MVNKPLLYLLITVLACAISAKKIFIDPAHGGYDKGVQGNGIVESDKALEIALKLGAMLEKSGIQVQYSRKSSINISDQERAKLINKWMPDYIVSIHLSTSKNLRDRGVESFYSPNGSVSSIEFAYAISRSIAKRARVVNIGAHVQLFPLMQLCLMPTVVVSVGFVSNLTEDVPKLKDFSHLHAEGIYEAILYMYSKYPK